MEIIALIKVLKVAKVGCNINMIYYMVSKKWWWERKAYNKLLSTKFSYCSYSPINEFIAQTDDAWYAVSNIANTFFSVSLTPKTNVPSWNKASNIHLQYSLRGT